MWPPERGSRSVKVDRRTPQLVVVGALAGGLLLAFPFMRPTASPDVGELEPVVARPAEALEVHELAAGQTLGEILSTAMGGTEQGRLLMAFREQASPRRMGIGTEITLRYRGSDQWLRGVDIMLNADETVRLRRDDFGWSSSTIRTPVWVDTIYAAGRIEASLWNAVMKSPSVSELPSGDRNALIDRLDKIFQWQIDFSRQIQKGDAFRVAFELQVRPDGSVRSERVISAEVVNVGKSLTAIWFDPNGDGEGTYYDLEGQSVRRAFLKKPVAFRYITSRFSNSRLHPILQTWRAHRGVDYSAAAGTPIMATAHGVVSHRGPLGSLGTAVVIEHANGFRTRYGHMSIIASGVNVGTRVEQGQVIGYVGATGLATAPHLHYELWQTGRAVDPLEIELPADDPVPSESWDLWQSEVGVRWALIDHLQDRMRFPGGQPRVADIDEGDGAG